jgi:hypothetical protein
MATTASYVVEWWTSARRWILALALVGVGAADAWGYTPIRPTGRDLSIKWSNGTYAYRWFPLSGTPHTASQAERDAMEWTLFARTLEVIRAAGDLCPVEARYAYTQVNLVTTRVGVGSQYEGALQKPGGKTWRVGANGRHYSAERFVLKRFRSCLMRASVRDLCATRFAASAALRDLRDLLDLNEDCDGPAAFTFGELPSTIDRLRETHAIVDTRRLVVPPDPTQQMLLHQTHAAHAAVSDWRCGLGPQPPDGIVRTAHLAYEQSAESETQSHFFALKPFSGVEDPRWTRDELCGWARIQDVFHQRWMAAQEIGDWAGARQADTDHLFAHVCMNDATPRLRFLFSCGNGQRIDSCGRLRCADALSIVSKRLDL